jgi:hypothetical protein
VVESNGICNYTMTSTVPDETIEAPTTTTANLPASKSKLPIVSLAHGMRHKANAYELKNWVALALTLDGRDKITKIVQYVARLLSWWFAGRGRINQAQRFASLKNSLTTSRKAFRMGRSVIEFHRLRKMGLLEALGYYLQQNLDRKPRDEPAGKCLDTGGYGKNQQSLVPLLNGLAYRLQQKMATTFLHTEPKLPDTPLWALLGTALKTLGLMGFWAADNISFLIASGIFDNYRLGSRERLERRNRYARRASAVANRAYFGGAVAGLIVNVRGYLDQRQTTLHFLQQRREQTQTADEIDFTKKGLEKAREKHFDSFVALTKSVCDVLVFSNNPGIDLWQQQIGHKMHEGFHGLFGLISASAVLYNNYPAAC